MAEFPRGAQVGSELVWRELELDWDGSEANKVELSLALVLLG